MRLFQVDQIIFDLDKVTQAELNGSELTLNFVDGLPLMLTGEAAENVWLMLGSLSCKLPLGSNREVA